MQLFQPGSLLLNRLKFGKKFMLLFTIFIFSLATIGTFYIRSLGEKAAFVEHEKTGLVYMGEFFTGLQALQQHREATLLYLSGDTASEQKAKKAEQQLEQLIKHVQTMQQRENDPFAIQKQWKDFSNTWQQMKSGWKTYTMDETVSRHNIIINNLIEMMMTVADRSNLTLDSNIDNNYLSRLMVEKIPALTELISSAQALGVKMSFSTQIYEMDQQKMTYFLNAIDNSLNSLNHSASLMFMNDKPLQNKFDEYKSTAMTEVISMSGMMNKEFLMVGQVSIKPNELYERTNRAHEKLYNMEQFMMKLLAERINDRYESLNTSKWLTISIIVLASVLMVYLFVAFYFSVRHHITLIEAKMKQAATGDLTVKMNVRTNDEFAQIAQSFNELIESFRAIISVNQQMTEEVSAASEELTAITEETMQATGQVATTIENVAVGAEQQLKHAEQNTESIQELLHDTHYIADRAKQVASSSVAMTNEAQSGSDSVQQMIQQMANVNELVSQSSHLIQTLHERSNNIGQMTQMITAIAEQTNLLALNAAIEAARAGEHGRGFAVVADEVRKLAEQSSQSAKQIHQLLSEIQHDTSHSMTAMEHVLQEAEKGVEVANHTGVIFGKILQATYDVTEQINDVSSRLSLMETSLQSLSATIQETEHISKESGQQTQMVAAASEQLLASMQEISSSVQSLNDKAQDLFEAVEKFKL
ncbi:methyl-accepting chemotaxis protein [Anoxybacillus voinovskiensis]|uniref:Methyl-accepting chemotaxis protein n=1 Tax=Anoxybacteroides voinovskiense TaxID=230470 RepID=A0A840DUY9_9BACL|nr:methyl-accepting chemotaxis protein [Anoxybacillus voinovskiensis]MBB4074177.1 methyl-accepting chemotaxis protein [Anoxybacillus voinovskiensis]GGJ57179.1 methyl-accepting chemotaxis protein [Anoxybacillus voinovskiensis]